METSKEMIDELLSYVDESSFVLEPSAGAGDVAFALSNRKNCIVDCVELNEDNFNYLQAHRAALNNVWHKNFLTQFHRPDMYDAVVAVPPYKDNIDCEHIMHMYEQVKNGGKVVTFTLPYWVTGNFTVQKRFRKWLSDKDYTMKLFEDDKSYLACPKMLLIIRK